MAKIGRPRAEVTLTDNERTELTRLTKRAHVNRAVAFRARVVLAVSEDTTDKAVARRLRTTKTTVAKWRVRFKARRLAGLYDEPRVGAPRLVSDDAVEAVPSPRHVVKGQKAIVLCQPVTIKRRGDDPEADDDGKGDVFTRLIYRPNWFVLAQTAGEAFEPLTIPDWDEARALAALDITEVPFEHLDGNCHGYARVRSIAVAPVAELPYRRASTSWRMWCWGTRWNLRLD